jgi:hypothetical protein
MMYTAEIDRCHDRPTKFHKNWFKHSKVNGGGDDRQHEDRISVL